MPCIQPSSQPSCHLMKPCGFPQAVLSKRSAACDVPPCEPRGPAMARGQPCGYHARFQKKTKICLHLARTQKEAGFHRRPSVAHEMPATAIHTGNTNHVHDLTYRQTIREAQVTGHRNEPRGSTCQTTTVTSFLIFNTAISHTPANPNTNCNP